MSISLEDCIARDRADPLGFCAQRFHIDPGTIYLDGNSLGALPADTAPTVLSTTEQEWGIDLIQSWNKADWYHLPATLGDRIGRLTGAESGQIVVCDNTSINLFKCLHAALAMNPERSRIVAHKGDFPTDLYMIQGVATSASRSIETVLVEGEEDILPALDQDTAVAVVSQVNYKSGRIQDMEALSSHARDRGVILIWDLCHSVGVMPIELDRAGIDFAVGCTYKYLNGGPGAPAFVYAANRHHSKLFQPLCGWWSHASPFDFSTDYKPSAGIKRMLTGTQPVLSLRGVGCGLDTFNDIDMAMVRRKSMALCSLFIDLVNQQCEGLGISVLGPDNVSLRGSHVSLEFDQGFSVIQAMTEQGVIGDFRAPNLMRFGFAPLYISYRQVWDAVTVLRHCINKAPWNEPRYNQRSAVT